MKVKVIAIVGSVILVAGVGILGYFYMKKNDVKPVSTSQETTSVDPYAGKARSYLTGEYIDEKDVKLRPYAIMINNIQAAIPQSGISKASIIYESPVEGSITRMMALFEKPDHMKKIGSVRSCRIYFAYFSLEWDSIYCHYGQSKYAKKFLKSKKIDNICSWNGEGAYYRTNDKPAPHNCYTFGKGLLKQRKKLKYKKHHKNTFQGHFKFADIDKPIELANGKDAIKVKVGYSYNHAYYKYDKDNHQYYRYQYGQKHIDAKNNKQLHVSNIIIQYVKTKLYPDNKSLNMTLSGDGKGWFITRGKAIKIKWHKDKQKSGQTKFYDENGNEIVLNTGKTFVNIVQKEDKGKTKIISDKKKKSKKKL